MFAPSLKQVGLSARRTIFVEASSDVDVLACFEEGLRHGGLGAVVAEVARLSMTASRRLQLAAETSGSLGIAIRRWRRQTDAAGFRPAVCIFADARCGPSPLAAGTDPCPCGRMCRF
ncbi:hypothetical protein GHA01_23040 [Novacetimonas hansenii]|uniref:Uncharacterized protein n=2 Tax=Novacetimonas hansenii TaxID=436 RepID=A0ABQ0SGW2_NOVHA|nr:hypothetical protein GXY_03233 [Novacetimonas hansenii ATCC 23769]GBQ59943.1 hypothetical protein AA0243_2186 [Novacetimonas hansenii NRIC 0243]GEC64455.1 hypothetical protein GHA01_23040 [Novacetimonas hansenii]